MRVKIVNPNGTLVDSEVRINDIVDAVADAPVDGEILRYNASNGLWESGGEPDVILNTTHRLTAHDYNQISDNDGDTDITAAELEELSDGSETTLHSHAGRRYVDRGDPAAVDFDIGDLTSDSTWRDLDLSGIVPAGTTAVYLKVLISHSQAGYSLTIRKNGNSNTVNVLSQLTQAANIPIFVTGVVACDSNRVVEYRLTNSVWVACDIVVLGWWMG